jgi:flagella basal body P-ring formation protein FlgA
MGCQVGLLSKTPHPNQLANFVPMKPVHIYPSLRMLFGIALVLCISLGSVWASSESLTAKVKHWIAEQHGVQISSISVQELDHRFHIPQCASDWQFDQPFNQDTTVRARCINSGRQLFVYVQFPKSAPIQQKDVKQVGLSSFVTTKTNLTRGTILTEEHLTSSYRAHSNTHPDVIVDVSSVVGQELVRHVSAGYLLREQDVRPALMFKRGQEVLFTTRSDGGFQLTVKLEAAEDGRMGQRVRLLNRESGRNVFALVTGPNTAQAL